jgi:hypothetical protein
MEVKRLIALIAVSVMAFAGTAQGQTVPLGPAAGVASEDVEYVGFVPFEVGTSTGIAIHDDYMYLTSWKNISIYDISDPTQPVQVGFAPLGFQFENEEVQVSPDGSFLLFAESLPNDILHVWDVEDKTNPVEVAQLEGAGDHTTTCILKCKWAYGSDGSIVDLRDYKDPKLMMNEDGTEMDWRFLATGLKFSNHDITEVRNGLILDSPIEGNFHYMKVKNPLKPKVLAEGIKEAEEGWLYHSANWPRAGKDDFIVMQGELNAQPRCEELATPPGPIQVYDARKWQKSKKFTLIDTYRVANGTYADGSPAVNGLGCSAHWFEEHPTFKDGGLLAIGYYEHGTRFVDVSSNGKLKEVGYFLPFGGSTSAAYWVEETKDAKLVYAVDYTRGIDILRWNGDV